MLFKLVLVAVLIASDGSEVLRMEEDAPEGIEKVQCEPFMFELGFRVYRAFDALAERAVKVTCDYRASALG